MSGTKRCLFRGVALVNVEAVGESDHTNKARAEQEMQADAKRKMEAAIEALTGERSMVTSITNKSEVPQSDGTDGPKKTVTEAIAEEQA